MHPSLDREYNWKFLWKGALPSCKHSEEFPGTRVQVQIPPNLMESEFGETVEESESVPFDLHLKCSTIATGPAQNLPM